ncbi:hypothetical protein FOZ63_003793, partial [Perkinsus olseni]
IVDELARQCPPVAEAILSSTSADNILSGFAAIAHHQGRSESYRAATASGLEDTMEPGRAEVTTSEATLLVIDVDPSMVTANPKEIYADLCRKNDLCPLKCIEDALGDPQRSFTAEGVSCCIRGDGRPQCTRVTAVHCRLLCRALEIAGVRIDTIDLSHNPIQDEGCTAIASLVKDGAKKIKLRGCMLSGTGVSRLLSALRSSSRDMEELDFSDNPIGTEAGVEIAEYA